VRVSHAQLANFCFFLLVASRYTHKRVPHGAAAVAAAAAAAAPRAQRPPRPPPRIGTSSPIGLPSAVRAVVSSAVALPRSFAAGFYGRSLVVRPESPVALIR
jgi:hypothetical protein